MSKSEFVQSHIKDLISKIEEYRSNDKYCDVNIRVEEKLFKCHRLVLAAACEYFDAMLGGNFKEREATEIVLQDVEAVTFEMIIQFIYTGSILITNSTVLNVMRASEFYGLPRINELCIKYIRKNLSVLTNYVMKIYLFARATHKAQLVDFLELHICAHFDHFSKTTEFLESSFEVINSILCRMREPSIPICQDLFLAAIIRWIEYDGSRRSFSQELLQNISFGEISSEYMEYAMKHLLSIESTNVGTTLSIEEDNYVVNKPLKVLHVYFYGTCTDEKRIQTSMFSLYDAMGVARSSDDHFAWIYSGEMSYNTPRFMRSVVHGDKLYTLMNHKLRRNNTFSMSSSISLFASTLLKPPPLTMTNFELCVQRNSIYLNNKKIFCNHNNIVQRVEDSSFSMEALTNNIYLFNTEVDKWFPLPYRQIKYNNSCMTSDEHRVYLIGGTGSNNYVGAYDNRSSEWITLASTTCIYDAAAACVYNGKIYVCGGISNPTSIEVYNPVAGKWQRLRQMCQGTDNHQFIEYKGYLHIIDKASVIKRGPQSKIQSFHPNNDWYESPSLYEAIRGSNLIPVENLTTLNAVVYYPYGL